jgi:hypothetical protein
VTGHSETLYEMAKKATVYAVAFAAVATAMGMLNKWLIADPIARSISEERLARQFADSLIIVRLNTIVMHQSSSNGRWYQFWLEAQRASHVVDSIGRARRKDQ